MKISLKLLLSASIGFSGFGSVIPLATAMPVSGLNPALAAAAESAKGVENIRWNCGPYGGCRRAYGWPHYGWGPGYAYWGPRFWWGPPTAYEWRTYGLGAYRFRYYW